MAMRLGENSRVAVSNGKLAMDHGSAAVSSTGRISTVSSQYAIKPVDGYSARYLVSSNGGSLSVTPKSGGVAITGPSNTSQVLSGQKASFANGNYNLFSSNDGESAHQNSFGQLMGPYSSGFCRTSKTCFCKTAGQCSK
jgi:hypothetical protein